MITQYFLISPGAEEASNSNGNSIYDDSRGSIDEEGEDKDGGHDVRSIGVQASQPEPDLVGKLIELVGSCGDEFLRCEIFVGIRWCSTR